MQPSEASVLVIDDSPDNQQLIALMLRSAGVGQITVRASGRQALSAARDLLPRVDLILLDLYLQSEDGYTILRQIRATPQLKATRVVAVSADADPPSIARVQAAGFDGFLGKPLDFHHFPQQIQALLQGEAVWALPWE